MNRSSSQPEFEQTLAEFLTRRSNATAGAPTANVIAARIGAATQTRPRGSLALRPAWVALLLATVLALLATVAWIAGQTPPPPVPSPSVAPSLAGTVTFRGPSGTLVAIDPETGHTQDLVYCASYCLGLTSPAWSPDGTRLAYLKLGDDALPPLNQQAGFWVTDIASGATTQLTRCLTPVDCREDRPIAWSPDGAWLAFFQGDQVSIVPSAGGELSPIADAQDASSLGSDIWWSADSRTVNYVVNGAWSSVDIDGANARSHSVPSALFLEVSPDGSQLAYVTDERGPVATPPATRAFADPFVAQLWVSDIDGTNARVVAELPGCCALSYLGPPAWSQDGKSLAWVGHDGSISGPRSIALVVTIGQPARQLALVAESRPAWAP